MKTPNFSIIAACDCMMGIGKNNRLPWKIPKELDFFKKTTTSIYRDNYVIMGYNTWKSIPREFKPLTNRKNIVLTRCEEKIDKLYQEYNNSLELECFTNIDELVHFSKNIVNKNTVGNNHKYKYKTPTFWIIGGNSLYKEFLLNNKYNVYVKEIILTNINYHYKCDTFIPIYKEYIDEYYFLNRVKKQIMYDKSINDDVNTTIQFYIRK